MEYFPRQLALLGPILIFYFLSACVSSPLNKQEIPSHLQPISVSGLIQEPDGVDIFFMANGKVMENSRVKWGYKTEYQEIDGERVLVYPTGEYNLEIPEHKPITDAAGKVWYKWNRDDFVVGHWEEWAQVEGERKISINLTAFYDDNDNVWQPMHSFDAGQFTKDCINRFNNGDELDISNLDIVAVISNCRSKDSPNITLYAPCGGLDHSCCKEAPACDGDLTCQADTHLCKVILPSFESPNLPSLF